MGKNHQYQRSQHNPKQNRKVNNDNIRQNSLRNQEKFQHKKRKKELKKNQELQKPAKVLIERRELANLVNKSKPGSQPPAEESLQESAITKLKFFINMIASIKLNKQQKLALFFICLRGVDGAVNTYNEINNQRPNTDRPNNDNRKLTATEKRAFLTAVCTNMTEAENKHPDFTIGAQKSQLIPVECYHNKESRECRIELNKYSNFYASKTSVKKKFQELRDSYHAENQQWMSNFANKFNSILSTNNLDAEQENYFYVMINSITKLKESFTNEKIVQVYNMANCGEQTSAAIKAFLLKKIEFGLNLKIQFIYLNAVHPRNNNKIQDHAFLLLNGNIPDQTIENDPKALAQLLSQITSGFYCDPWNHLFANAKDIPEDRRSLYTAQGGWLSGRFESVELDFKHFSYLPPVAQKLFCDELNHMGFPVEFHPVSCTNWNPRVAKKQEQKNSIRPELK